MGPSEWNIENYGQENTVAFRAQELDPEDDLDSLAGALCNSDEPQKLPWQTPCIHSMEAPLTPQKPGMLSLQETKRFLLRSYRKLKSLAAKIRKLVRIKN